MKDTFKKIVVLFVISAIAVVLISVAFFSNLFKEAREVEDVDNLSGRRIAVVASYEADYLLSDRKDLTLLRYETQSESLMALCYQQVDAYALLLEDANHVLSCCSGLKINEKPLAEVGLASVFSKESNLAKEFNAFIAEYKKTDEYQEYTYRCDHDGYYDGTPITEETGTGRTITLGYVYDYMPGVFYDTINGCPNGIEVDIFRKFANYMNYQIKWVQVTEMTGINEITSGNIDILLAGYCDLFRGEIERASDVEMGDAYRVTKIVLIQVDDYDNLAIWGIAEED